MCCLGLACPVPGEFHLMLLHNHMPCQVMEWKVGQVSAEMLFDLSCISTKTVKGIIMELKIGDAAYL